MQQRPAHHDARVSFVLLGHPVCLNNQMHWIQGLVLPKATLLAWHATLLTSHYFVTNKHSELKMVQNILQKRKMVPIA